MSNADDPKQAFMLIEHACMQEKIRHASTDLYRTETIVPIAIAVTYAWLYAQEDPAKTITAWMWWVPVVIAAFGAWRQKLRYRSLWGHHTYVKMVEKEIYGDENEASLKRPRGWERYWSATVSPTFRLLRWRVSPHGFMRIVFWTLLMVGTAFLAYDKTLAKSEAPARQESSRSPTAS